VADLVNSSRSVLEDVSYRVRRLELTRDAKAQEDPASQFSAADEPAD
jgi:hypothetical protein